MGNKKRTFHKSDFSRRNSCSPGYPFPLYKNPLFQRKGKGPEYCPVSCPYYGEEIDYSTVICPNAEKLCKQAVWIPHPVLLGEKEDMKDIVNAIEKVWENRKDVKLWKEE